MLLHLIVDMPTVLRVHLKTKRSATTLCLLPTPPHFPLLQLWTKSRLILSYQRCKLCLPSHWSWNRGDRYSGEKLKFDGLFLLPVSEYISVSNFLNLRKLHAHYKKKRKKRKEIINEEKRKIKTCNQAPGKKH